MKGVQILVSAALGFPLALAAEPKTPDFGTLLATECLDVLGDCPDVVAIAQDLSQNKKITFDTILDKIESLGDNPPSNKCKLTLADCVGKVAKAAVKEALGADEKSEDAESSGGDDGGEGNQE
ncbi:hypothetical protein NQ176_g4127 [Zarea fungicola]|uniref:Uncharacterized protein n=1 Tax=Zarea fungicola TaxID=93591 RepID=A0ACC1NHI3_9HYPO|nr:hypothetical protein NQ176_g4127 [Lecanicillium fungicola]